MTEDYRGGAVLAEVVRSEFVEGFHRGSVVILDGDGEVRDCVGDIEAPV
ncbi:MAG: asparaginase, partial [Stackebrandtia sp.]